MKDSTRTSDGMKGLDPQFCTDPQIFQRECNELFHDRWFLVGYESNLVESGQFQRQQTIAGPLILIRGHDGKLRVFQNVCRHRGTEICVSSEGQISGGMTCPYHGWKYSTEGDLIAAPHMDSVLGFAKEDYGLIEIRSEIWHGMVFINRSMDAEPIGDFLNRLNPLASQRELRQFRRFTTIHYEQDANWKLFFQNFSECYHCPAVHPQLTPLSNYREAENDFSEGAILGGPMKIRGQVESITDGGGYCGRLPESLPQTELGLARYYTVFPGFFLSLFPDYVMVHRLLPITTEKTILECDFLFHPETIDDPDFDGDKAVRFWDQTNRQDWDMCERVQSGLKTPGFQPSPYSNLESLLAAFDQYYHRQMT